jgi:ribonuclease HII
MNNKDNKNNKDNMNNKDNKNNKDNMNNNNINNNIVLDKNYILNNLKLSTFFQDKEIFDKTEIQVGLDEAGRGCIFGPVFSAAVVWNPDFIHPKILEIKDSKKLSKKKRKELRDFIIRYSNAWSVSYKDNTYIDKNGIVDATFKSMHNCLDEIYTNNLKFKRILVDGNRFEDYLSPIEYEGFIKHNCIIKGDDKYISIAAASILAKTFRDEYIENLCNDITYLDDYDLKNNYGYGTKKHLEAIKIKGKTDYHRKTFKIKGIDYN